MRTASYCLISYLLRHNYIGAPSLSLPLSEAQRMGIYNAVKHNTRVLSISWSFKCFSAEESKQIGDLLKTNKTIQSINSSYNQLTDAWVQHLCDALKVNKTLQSIHLRWSQLTDAGVQHLCEALKINTTLQSIELRGNQIMDAGVQHICEALKINKTLKSINLSGNQITDTGVQHLCEALKINTTRRYIALDRNQITDAGVQHLCDLLKTNTTLQSIDLSHNQITDAGVQHICEALQNNKTLQYINLSWNLISYAGVQDFETAIKTNSNILCAYYHSQSPEIISLLQERRKKIRDLISLWKEKKHSIHHFRYSESMIFLALRENLMSAAEISELEAFAKQATKILPQIICSQHKQDPIVVSLYPKWLNSSKDGEEISGNADYIKYKDNLTLYELSISSPDFNITHSDSFTRQIKKYEQTQTKKEEAELQNPFAFLNPNACNKILGLLSGADQNALQEALSTSASVNSNAVNDIVQHNICIITDEKMHNNQLTFYNAALFVGFVGLNIIAYKGFVFAFEKAATVCVPNVDLDIIKTFSDLSCGAIYSCISFTIVVAWLEYRGICREISI